MGSQLLYWMYIHPQEVTFISFRTFTNITVTETEGLLICSGDLNIHLQPKLDTSSRKTHDKKSIHRRVNTLLGEFGLVDIWRDLFPYRRDYTYYYAPHSLYTRTDYSITFGKDKNKINACGSGTIDLSDHAPIYLSVDFNLRPKNNKRKLNLSLKRSHLPFYVILWQLS